MRTGEARRWGMGGVSFTLWISFTPSFAQSPESLPPEPLREEWSRVRIKAPAQEIGPVMRDAEKSPPLGNAMKPKVDDAGAGDKAKGRRAPRLSGSAPAAKPTAEEPSSRAGVTYVAIDYSDLPGWAEDDHLAALKAFVVSCPPLIAASKAGNKAGAIPTPPDLLAVCAAALQLPAKLTRSESRAFFEQQFRPHRIVHAASQGLLTGYYEPLIEGSRQRQGKFQWPILRRPADLVNVVDESQRGAAGAQLTHARVDAGGKLVPYATRAEIDAGALDDKGLELFYLADPVDVFFLQIQGSGRIKLADGSVAQVNYDGKNGHPYTSIGRYLIDNSLMTAGQMSMGALGRWLKADRERGRRVMQQNASYVFFRELNGDTAGPLGVLGIPLTTGRSLAVDAGVHALGLPIFVNAPTLTHALKGQPFQRLLIAQDVGSAIKGAERGDIYFGSGDAAGRIAGITKHPGHLVVFRPRTSTDQGREIATGSTEAASTQTATTARGGDAASALKGARQAKP